MTDIRELLAKNIKEYRKLRGFSQENLAEKAGTSTTHIGMIGLQKSNNASTSIAFAFTLDFGHSVWNANINGKGEERILRSVYGQSCSQKRSLTFSYNLWLP
jgi:transcriptional regulator with XRE-family HTH domain